MNQETDSDTDRSLSPPCAPSCFELQLPATKFSLEEVEAAFRHLRCVEAHRLVKVLLFVRSTGGSSQLARMLHTPTLFEERVVL